MAGMPLASPSDAAVVIVNRNSCLIGFSISGMQGPRWNTLHTVGVQGWWLNTLQTPCRANADSTCNPAATTMTPTKNWKTTGRVFMLAYLVHTLDGFKQAVPRTRRQLARVCTAMLVCPLHTWRSAD